MRKVDILTHSNNKGVVRLNDVMPRILSQTLEYKWVNFKLKVSLSVVSQLILKTRNIKVAAISSDCKHWCCVFAEIHR